MVPRSPTLDRTRFITGRTGRCRPYTDAGTRAFKLQEARVCVWHLIQVTKSRPAASAPSCRKSPSSLNVPIWSHAGHCNRVAPESDVEPADGQPPRSLARTSEGTGSSSSAPACSFSIRCRSLSAPRCSASRMERSSAAPSRTIPKNDSNRDDRRTRAGARYGAYRPDDHQVDNDAHEPESPLTGPRADRFSQPCSQRASKTDCKLALASQAVCSAGWTPTCQSAMPASA